MKGANNKIPLVIFGSGGLAKELIGYIAGQSEYYPYVLVGCVSSEPFNNPRFELIVESEPDSFLDEYGPPTRFLLAVSSPLLKKELVKKQMLTGNGLRFISYVHPSAVVSPFAFIGQGSILAPGAIVTGDAAVGEFVFMNTNATVGHDALIGAYSTLFPNTEVCGDCDLGEGSVMGIGSYVLPGKKIGPRTRISAGSIVRHSFPQGDCTLQGNPARVRGEQ